MALDSSSRSYPSVIVPDEIETAASNLDITVGNVER
jgi:hypothetical protein